MKMTDSEKNLEEIRAQVRRRMAAQWSDAARCAHADFILENNDRQALLPAILAILEKIKEDGKD